MATHAEDGLRPLELVIGAAKAGRCFFVVRKGFRSPRHNFN